MDVKILTSPRTARDHLVRLVQECDRMSFAVAWATHNAVLDAALEHQDKFDRLVIGTHRCVTDPAVLTECARLDAFRAIAPTGDLFHPKVYAFRTGDIVHAFVGSNNLTRNGFGANAEAGVLLSAATTDGQIRALLVYINEQWHRGMVIDDAWIEGYAANRRRTVEAARELDRWVPVKAPKVTGRVGGPQTLGWPDFVRSIQDQDTHEFADRLKVLNGARKIFATHESFAGMATPVRKRIAGTTTTKEMAEDGFDWQYFGGMGSNGGFSSTVINNPMKISLALDAIPLQGAVTRDHYEAFVEQFVRAFKGAVSYNKLGTGSRLLSMKRPDFFVGINGPNQEGICEQFGVPASTTDLRNYWDRIIEPMQLTPWWRSPRPEDTFERDIWDGRAAMLDSLYYDETQRTSAK
jgi:HKD family nuclease